MVRTLVGISGNDFLSRLDDGFYDAVIDDLEHADVMYLALLAEVVR